MEKPAKLLLFGAIGFLAYSFIAKKNAASRLQFYVSKVALRFSGITPILDIILAVQNPTQQNLKVGSILGELYINGNYAANISGFQLTDIKSFGVSYFPISARLSISGVVSQIIDIINGLSSGAGIQSLANQVLTFKGTVNAEGVSVPLNFNYKVL